jgi:DNA polymerase III subunit gamma/tau
VEAIATDHPEAVLEQTRYLLNRGREPLVVLQSLAGFYRDLLIAKTAPERQDLVAITPTTWASLCHFAQSLEVSTILTGQQHLRACEAQVKTTSQPRLWLEITLLGLLPGVPVPNRPGNAATPAAAAAMLRPPSPVAALPPVPAPAPIPLAAPETVKAPTVLPTDLESEPATPAQPPRSESFLGTANPDLQTPPEVEEAELPPLPSSAAPAEVEAVPKGVDTPSPPATTNLGDGIQPQLSATWLQLMSHLHPLSQALLNQHGRLLSLEEHQAQVGIRSQNLAKIAQSKLPDVETAFMAILNRKVKVSLRVMTPQEWQTLAASPVPTLGDADAPAAAAPHPSTTPNTLPAAARPQDLPPSPIPRPAQVAAPQPPVALETPAPLGTAPPWEEDEVVRAAKSLAQLFNGEIVDLDSGVDGPLGPGGSTPPPAVADFELGSDLEEEEELPF